MVLSMAGFAIGDAFVKASSDTMSIAQVLIFMSAPGAIVFAVLGQRAGQPAFSRAFFDRPVILRNCIEGATAICMVSALSMAPLGLVIAIIQAVPLFVTLGAALILKERVGPRRWIAVIIGFVGVVLVVGPTTDDVGWLALAPLGSAFFYALSGVSARMMDDDVPSPVLSFYSASAAMLGSVIMALAMGGFSPIGTATDLLWILAMGGFGGCAVITLVISYRMTEQSNLAPFSYFGIPTAFFFGWLFFEEAPWRDLFPGAILIVMGGLLVIWRERRLRAQTRV